LAQLRTASGSTGLDGKGIQDMSSDMLPAFYLVHHPWEFSLSPPHHTKKAPCGTALMNKGSVLSDGRTVSAKPSMLWTGCGYENSRFHMW